MKKLILLSIIVITVSSRLFSQERIALIEQFSNSSCAPCGAVSPYIYDFADNNPLKTIAVSYHTAFPYYNDSMYFENPSEVNQRVSYYSVVSVPFSILDGNVYAGPSNSFTTSISGLVDNRISVSPRYAIKKLSLFVSGNQLKGSFQFTSGHAANSSEILVAHIVAIERNVSKSDYAASPGSNNETEYGYVMRKMIPDANGTALLNTSLAGKDTVMFSWTLNHIKNTGELRVVAFVQNFSTKEVYQAQFFVVDNTPVGMKEPESAPALDLKVFPNPLKDSFTLLFNGVTVLKELSITDPVGKTVYALTINASTDRILVEPRLNPGLYLLKISTGDQTLIKKILVAH